MQYTLSESTVRKLAELTARQLAKLRGDGMGGHWGELSRSLTGQDLMHYMIPWRNDTNNTCPPGGVFRVTGAVLDNQQYALTGERPGSTFYREYRANGLVEVEYGKWGLSWAGKTAIAFTDAAATKGEGWGPKSGQWSLTKNYPRTATILGEVESSPRLSVVDWGLIDILLGKLGGSLAVGGSTTFDIWAGAGGSEAAISGWSITVRDWLMKSGASALSSGKKGLAQFIHGTWYLTQVECE